MGSPTIPRHRSYRSPLGSALSRPAPLDRACNPLVVSRPMLGLCALLCLLAFVILASFVAHGTGPYGFENPVFRWLGSPSSTAGWAKLSKVLPLPVIVAALVVSVIIGIAKRAMVRVLGYAALVVVIFLISEYVAKPLVQRTYFEELTFPSGSVTAVCAAALATWFALSPVLGRRARAGVFTLGLASTLVIAVAVVGALWHTPLDVLGSVLLSAGCVTGACAVFDPLVTDRRGRMGGRMPTTRD
jgi:hypothetical protein